METKFNKALNAFSQSVVDRAKRNINAKERVNGKQRRIFSSGELYNSLRYKLGANNKVVRFTASGEAAKYVNSVEYGRLPGKMPPIDAIKTWIKTKPLRLRELKGSGAIGGKKFVKKTEAAIDQAAYLIARKIGREGTEATYFYHRALEWELDLQGDKMIDAMIEDIYIKIGA